MVSQKPKSAIFSQYKKFLKKNYPNAYWFLTHYNKNPCFFWNSITLSRKIYQQIPLVVSNLFQLKNNKDYQKSLFREDISKTALKKTNQDSVLMGYDFHLQGDVFKLIEVNTNASDFLLLNSLYQFKDLDYEGAKESLKRSFKEEWKRFNQDKKKSVNKKCSTFDISSPKKIVLIDYEPVRQNLAIEFFMYKDFFKSIGWGDLEICDIRHLKMDDKNYLYTPKGEKIDFIYNRSTDFYFKNYPLLAEAYLKNTCAISPNPRAYYLLSDKKRLCDWSANINKWKELRYIKKHLLFARTLTADNQKETWENRKKYFFKIQQGYGGKLVYRGNKISQKKFKQLSNLSTIFQEFCSAFVLQYEEKKWKVDFRAYVYRSSVQQISARVYQGQLTNLRVPGSGFATVIFV